MPKLCEMVSKVARDAQLVFFCVSSALVSEVLFWCEPSQRWSSKWKGGNFTSFCLLSSAILIDEKIKRMTMRTMKIRKEHYCCGCCRGCCGCCWRDIIGLHPAVLVCDSDGQYGSGGSHREACGNATDAGSGVDFRWVWPFFPSRHHPLLRAMLQMKRRSIDVRMFGNLDMPHPFIDGMVEWLDLNPYCYPEKKPTSDLALRSVFFGSEFWGFATCFGQYLTFSRPWSVSIVSFVFRIASGYALRGWKQLGMEHWIRSDVWFHILGRLSFRLLPSRRVIDGMWSFTD